jgi:hypothetical protein
MTFEYELTIEDLLESYQQASDPMVTGTIRRTGWLLLIVGGALIVAAAVVVVLMGARTPPFVGVFVAFGLVSIFFARTMFRLRTARLKGPMDPRVRQRMLNLPAWANAPVGPHRLTIDESGLLEERRNVTTSVAWAAVRSVRDTELLILIAFESSKIIIPKRALGPDAAAVLASINELRAGAVEVR